MKFIEQSFEILTPNYSRDEVLKQIELAARTCYKSENRICEGSASKLVSKLVQLGHEAMLEHGPSLSVRFITDRGVTHELVRHRVASFAQESTRYVKYGEDMEFIVPVWLPARDREILISGKDEFLSYPVSAFVMAIKLASLSYTELMKAGWKAQEARAVLPNSLKTEIVVTANLREWKHIFELRCSKAAHPQIRDLMLPLLKYMSEILPEIFENTFEEVIG